jgi:hypothetical protein
MESNTQFEAYIADEISRHDGVAIPIKSGLLHRPLKRRCSCLSLHPNPDDEFSHPSVGPSYRIISDYEKKFLNSERVYQNYFMGEEPIVVERIHPDGYMILNGHHRWAAALRLGYPKIPVQVVNVVHNQEIKEIVKHSEHNKRVTLDLDEVVFYNGTQGQAEKPLPFPLNKIYPDRLRLGIPALFRMLEKNGFDIWVYSVNYYSTDYIKSLLRKYHLTATGIVTGTSKRTNPEDKKLMEALYVDNYLYTLHLDNAEVSMFDNVANEFRVYPIKDKDHWSRDVINIIKELPSYD